MGHSPYLPILKAARLWSSLQKLLTIHLRYNWKYWHHSSDIPKAVLSILDGVSIEVQLRAAGVASQASHTCPRLCECIWQFSICRYRYTTIGMDTWGGAITPSAGQQTYSVRHNKCWTPSNQVTMKDKKGKCEFGEALGKLFGWVDVWVSFQEWDIFPFIGNHHYIKFYVLPIHIPNENWELLHITVVPGQPKCHLHTCLWVAVPPHTLWKCSWLKTSMLVTITSTLMSSRLLAGMTHPNNAAEENALFHTN